MAYPKNPIYKLYKDPILEVETGVTQLIGDSEPYIHKFIPFNEENVDYQEYLEWKAIDGNEPEAAD